jgi:predicted transcriptional regulator
LTYVIFEVKSEAAGNINKLIKDDLVSRQSIFLRDSSSLDIKGNLSYVKIEGSKDGIKRAEELAKELKLKKINQKKAKEINKKIEEQEDSAATGIGMIFD